MNKHTMTIAKGCTNRKAERDLILRGFCEQLQILKETQTQQESRLKARIYDIITDCVISEEEKRTLKEPWSHELEELEERNIRIRRTIFIGLYSFWEIALKDIVDSITNRKSVTDCNGKIKGSTKHAKNTPKAHCYLTTIYGDKIPPTVLLLDGPIRMIRNSVVHGQPQRSQKTDIESLIKSRPDFSIKADCGQYYFSDYEGLEVLMNTFAQELEQADNHASNQNQYCPEH